MSEYINITYETLSFKTSSHTVKFPVFKYDIAFEDLVSGDVVKYNRSVLMDASVWVSRENNTLFSPLPLNDNYVVNGNFKVQLTSTTFLKVYGSNTFATTGITTNNTLYYLVLLVDKNNKSVIVDGQVPVNSSSIISYTQPSSTDFGVCQLQYSQGNYASVLATIITSQLQYDDVINLYSSGLDSDPYSQGGNSGGGGGTGDFDDTSDTIGIPSLPSVSGLNTGFFTAFVCTQSQLQNVSNYLWTNVIADILDPNSGLGEKVDALKKMVTSPYDAIMGCSLVPVNPPTGGTKDVKMYGVIDTGINLPYASSRWVEVDCGTLNIHEFWGSYLDYSPYTKTTSLYLPYIGVVSVDIDLIMAKALQVVYHVDILTGICIAYIVVDGSVKFQYQGHCSTTIPVTASDYSGAIQSGLGLVGNIANVVSSGVSGGLSGGLGGATLGAVGSAISQAPSVASNVMGMKPDIKSGGGVGSSGGILGVQKPFLIIERPKQSVPAFQNGFSGYPCNMTLRLGDLTGYTEVERINLSSIALTEDEKNELYEVLESGVYL